MSRDDQPRSKADPDGERRDHVGRNLRASFAITGESRESRDLLIRLLSVEHPPRKP
ncbi:hypothetical protein GGR88_001974 [Sphingomonas jejuensis]|uniref:Uncharacterized protein n=1 Tax=Sphingomonas jejuensis TaxID=904715 RepID=A0ABX0XP67_9SPHN|nr:hypothetical protein [Sphingomonas jejuensis]NJC34460.1 hypothetical protein [Sphingomonas jejuensis]